MWHAFRRATRARVARGGNPDAMLTAATSTFRSLAEWCRPTTAAARTTGRATPGPAR